MTRSDRIARLPLLTLSLALACGDDSSATTTAGADSTSTSNGTVGPVTVTASPTVTAGNTTTGDTTSTGDVTTTSSLDSTTGEGTTAATTAATTSGSSSGSGSGTGSESGSGTTAGVTDDTIYEVQDGTIPEATDVDVQGVVVTGVGSVGFFAQEPPGGQYSGVFVYTGGAPTVSTGDEVDLIGATTEFNGLTEIDVTAGSVTATGVTGIVLVPDLVPLADLTAATGEPWEGVYVRIEGAPLTVVNLPGFSEFDVNDGGPDNTRIDNFIYSVPDLPAVYPGFAVNASFTAIQGPVNFTFGEFKIVPREAADVEGYMPPP